MFDLSKEKGKYLFREMFMSPHARQMHTFQLSSRERQRAEIGWLHELCLCVVTCEQRITRAFSALCTHTMGSGPVGLLTWLRPGRPRSRSAEPTEPVASSSSSSSPAYRARRRHGGGGRRPVGRGAARASGQQVCAPSAASFLLPAPAKVLPPASVTCLQIHQ